VRELPESDAIITIVDDLPARKLAEEKENASKKATC
jgi:hypothetical protein